MESLKLEQENTQKLLVEKIKLEAKILEKQGEGVENGQKTDLEGVTKENVELKSQIAKSNYRVNHLLSYITELEKDVEKEKTGQKKLEYRTLHLLRHIEDLSSHPISHHSVVKPEHAERKVESTGDRKITNTGERIIQLYWYYGGSKVKIAGDFTNWDLVDITETFHLSPGIYHYKFNVDGRWCYDMVKPTCDDGYSGFNNVLLV